MTEDEMRYLAVPDLLVQAISYEDAVGPYAGGKWIVSLSNGLNIESRVHPSAYGFFPGDRARLTVRKEAK